LRDVRTGDDSASQIGRTDGEATVEDCPVAAEVQIRLRLFNRQRARYAVADSAALAFTGRSAASAPALTAIPAAEARRKLFMTFISETPFIFTHDFGWPATREDHERVTAT
jgi:hypothetical protein